MYLPVFVGTGYRIYQGLGRESLKVDSLLGPVTVILDNPSQDAHEVKSCNVIVTLHTRKESRGRKR